MINLQHTAMEMVSKPFLNFLLRSRASVVMLYLTVFFMAGTEGVFAAEPQRYWVYFLDKGNGISSEGVLTKRGNVYQEVLDILSPKALQRRAKILSSDSVIDAADVPVYEPYIIQVQRAGGVLYQRSRWINAASFSLHQDQVRTVSALPFVKNVTPVFIARARQRSVSDIPGPGDSTTTTLNYGPSLEQVDMVNAVSLHQAGITGTGVRVGFLDSGFRWKTHESLQARNVIGEYDFIFHDRVTSNQSRDSSDQDAHGTYTLSTLGGYKEGKLIGPAYNAEFLLAKTEYMQTESSFEEDTWAAGIEWLEAQGAEIVTSSVAYDDFADTTGYTWEHGDFNGRTSVTAKAAIRAARLGVLVCQSMGNEGIGDGVEGRMLTPADADSILSVGAMTFQRDLAYFSSTGPTNDERIKPDIVAPGTSIYCATPGRSSYSYLQGTSLSTPLVAGSAALVLSARPELTAIQLRDVIRNTADTTNTSTASFYHEFPNNYFGWGLVDAFNAALSFGPIFSNQPTITTAGSVTTVSTVVVSKFGINPASVLVYYKTDASAPFSSTVMQFDSSLYYPTSGHYTWIVPSSVGTNHVQFYIEARDSSGHLYTSPAPVLNQLWQFCCGAPGGWSGTVIPAESKLLQNYPNPFNSSTTITIEMKQCEQAEVAIYSLTGQKITTLFSGIARPEITQLHWGGMNDRGESVASGIYFVTLTTPSFTSSKSMLLLR